MSWNNKVVWSEGLFLQPQHFQQQDRHWESLLQSRTKPLLGHSWGFVDLEVDRAGLELGKIQLLSASGIFPDGTPFDFPREDPPPPALDVPLDTRDEIIVLALPLVRPGTEDTHSSDSNDNTLARFTIGEAEIADSTAISAQSAVVRLGRLRMRLMRKRDLTDAYTTVGLVRVTERRPNNQLVLSKTYIPPVLHAGNEPVLSSYLRELHGLLHHRGEAIASRLSQPGTGGAGEIAEFLLLQTVNRYEPLFAHLARHPLLHPERLFSVCVQLAGELGTFANQSTRPSVFGEYEHDALEQSFAPVLAELRRCLTIVLEQSAISIELQDRKHGYRLALIPDRELLKSANFVLAVAAQVPQELLRVRFPTQVKIGPVEQIQNFVTSQIPGIRLQALPVAPRQIPFHVGRNYFELDRNDEIWKQLERSAGMAMHISGDFPGLELELWAIRG